jgi:hypothetical protein
MSEENLVPTEPEFKPTISQEEIDAVLTEIKGRSFSGRHPELGKMKKCFVCSLRHRESKKCEQKFTNRVGDYELYREDKDGNLVPDERTAIPSDDKPTVKQIMGAAQFVKKRYNPHPSRIKLILIERVRVVFERLGFELVDSKSEEFKALPPDEQKAKVEKFKKDLHRARVVAAREIRKERAFSSRAIRRVQDKSRRINRGLA